MAPDLPRSSRFGEDTVCGSAGVLSDRPVAGPRPEVELYGRSQERDGQRTRLERTMQNDVNDVIGRLEAIRRSVGGRKIQFVPHIEDRDLSTLGEVEELFHPSGLLVYFQNPVFIYIRDHTVGTFLDTIDRHKIHFSVCTTLRMMRNRGRFERYRRTTRVDDVYLIDVHTQPSGYAERELPLYPCKHCLQEVNYPCYRAANGREERQGIVERFRARDALLFLREKFRTFDSKTRSVQSADLFAGYSSEWSHRSRWYREHRNLTCEECGVQLAETPHLLDTHHIDGDKRNDRYQNLRCLCKLCHARIHPHYKILHQHSELILEARRNQGLSDING